MVVGGGGGGTRESRQRRRARRRGMKGTISALLPHLDGRYFPGGHPATRRLLPFSTAAKATVTLDFVYWANTHTHQEPYGTPLVHQRKNKTDFSKMHLRNKKLVVQFCLQQVSCSLQCHF